jgi:hypothetical protein
LLLEGSYAQFLESEWIQPQTPETMEASTYQPQGVTTLEQAADIVRNKNTPKATKTPSNKVINAVLNVGRRNSRRSIRGYSNFLCLCKKAMLNAVWRLLHYKGQLTLDSSTTVYQNQKLMS